MKYYMMHFEHMKRNFGRHGTAILAVIKWNWQRSQVI